jgi:hypothetical protein
MGRCSKHHLNLGHYAQQKKHRLTPDSDNKERGCVYTCLLPRTITYLGQYYISRYFHCHYEHLANPTLVELWCLVTRKPSVKDSNLYIFLSFQQAN